MNVLITGGAGYIGSHTCVELLNEGHSIVVVDNFSNSKPEALRRIKQITGADFPVYKLDVRDRTALNKVFSENRIDAAIHFAGYKAVGESTKVPLKYYQNNLDSTFSLCSVMEEHGVYRLVFSSSATVYGIPEEVPIKETARRSCLNPYGWSKLMLEKILEDIAAADSRWSIIALRYFNPIGAHGSGLIGEDPNGIPNNLMPYISQVAIGRREKLYIFGNDYDTADGTGVRDYIHVVDLAKGHAAALRYLQNRTGMDFINLGTGQGYSVLEVVNTFERVNNIKVPYEFTGRREGDAAICFADAQKAEQLLNWKAHKTLEDMCRDTWNWQSKNPNGYE